LTGCGASAGDGGRQVVVNGTRLDGDALEALDGRVQARVPDGRYWYDRRAGLWGWEGGPTEGVTAAGLDVGGALRADASRGRTGVFVNGREVHRLELDYLQRLFGPVRPGRYWLDANGVGGFEGGPAQFNLFQAARRAQAPRRITSGYDFGTAVIGDRRAIGVISRTGGVTFGPGGPTYDH
jgi:hypothetical protein